MKNAFHPAAALAALPILFTACTQPEPTAPADTAPISAAKPAYRPDLLEEEGLAYIRDGETGAKYLLNPNRRALPVGEPVAAVVPALGKTAGALYSMYDWSGQVEVRIWECQTTVRQEIQAGVSCQVDPEYVLIGGGARAYYYGSGALLTETRPLDYGLYTWVASSKSHKSSDPHHLRVYAIGLKLANLSRDMLWYQTSLHSSTGSISEAPTTFTPTNPSWHISIGGGARVNWSNPGSMLTASFPYSRQNYPWGWEASAKSHKASSPASVTTYVIGINPNISHWGVLDVNFQFPTGVGGSGLLSVSNQVEGGYVLACPSVTSYYTSGSGRMLYGITPDLTTPGKLLAFSKDHLTSSPGSLHLGAVELSKAP